MSFNAKSARLALCLGAATCAFSVAHVAAAADAAPAATTVPEVLVTAERRTENLQKVAIAATVLNGKQLKNEGVNRIADLQNIAPSVAISTYNRSTFINIRGVGIAVSAPTSTPGVAYYVNGEFLPHEFNIANTFFDLASVEVLRGPQGTLAGQNSTGGAIFVRTPEPRFDKVTAFVDETLSNYNGNRTEGAVNIPFNSMIAARIAGVDEKRDSFTKNIGPGAQTGNVDTWSMRGDLEFKPTDRFQTNLRYETYTNDTNGNAYKNRADTANGPFVIEEDAQGYAHYRGYRAGAEFKYNITDSLLLRYQYTNQKSLIEDLVDGDRGLNSTATPAPNNGRLGYTKTVNNTQTHEVNLVSSGDSPLQFVVGAYFFNENVPVSLKTYGHDTVNPVSGTTSDIELYAVNKSESVFGQISYRFSPEWQLVVGARDSQDEQTFTRFSGVPLLPTTPYTSSEKSTQPTGKVALNYNLSSDTLIYATVSKGYKGGGVNLVAQAGNFAPETNTVEELGLKTEFMDHRLRLNADVFDSQYNNLQLSSLTPAHLPTTANVSKSKSYGVEAEATGVFGAWQFNAAVAYVDATTNSDSLLLNNTVVPSVLTLVPSGTRLPFSPEWTANAGIQYQFVIGEGTLTPRLQVNYLDKQYAVIFENANSIVPSHETLDFRLTYDPSKAFEIQGYVTNLTNKTYIAAQIQDSSSANGGIIYGAPRQYGVRLVARFN